MEGTAGRATHPDFSVNDLRPAEPATPSASLLTEKSGWVRVGRSLHGSLRRRRPARRATPSPAQREKVAGGAGRMRAVPKETRCRRPRRGQRPAPSSVRLRLPPSPAVREKGARRQASGTATPSPAQREKVARDSGSDEGGAGSGDTLPRSARPAPGALIRQAPPATFSRHAGEGRATRLRAILLEGRAVAWHRASGGRGSFAPKPCVAP